MASGRMFRRHPLPRRGLWLRGREGIAQLIRHAIGTGCFVRRRDKTFKGKQEGRRRG